MSLLAEDEITITLGAESITLRPSLRAAMRIERKFGGFENVVGEIFAGNISAMATIVREGADRHTNVPDLLEEIGLSPLNLSLSMLTGPLLAFTYRLAGVDLSDPSQVEDKGTPSRVDWAIHHERLFQIGVGWLGLCPADVWEATPAELMAGYQGRLEMLRAVFGGGEETKPDTSSMSLDEKIKLALGAHNVKTVRRSSKGRAANA